MVGGLRQQGAHGCVVGQVVEAAAQGVESPGHVDGDVVVVRIEGGPHHPSGLVAVVGDDPPVVAVALEVEAVEPGVALAEQASQVGGGGERVDHDLLVDPEEVVDLVVVEPLVQLDEERDDEFAGLDVLVLGPAEQCVERRRVAGDLVDAGSDTTGAPGQRRRPQPRGSVVAADGLEVHDGPVDPASEGVDPLGRGWQGPDVGESELADARPGVEHPRVLEGVGDQAQPGGVAEPEVAPPVAGEPGRSVAAPGPGTVFDLVVAEFAEHPGAEELRPVGGAQGVPLGVAEVRAHAELAVAVEGGAAEDVAGVGHLVGLGLESGG